jgi:hypothetical protein
MNKTHYYSRSVSSDFSYLICDGQTASGLLIYASNVRVDYCAVSKKFVIVAEIHDINEVETQRTRTTCLV